MSAVKKNICTDFFHENLFTREKVLWVGSEQDEDVNEICK